ncbi:MAG TPA: carboxypeptidase-like regulatory domain-containing protein [Candidatus Dormibacteraeota bacterium]
MVRRVLAGCVLALALAACATSPGMIAPASGRLAGHVSTRTCGGAARDEQSSCRFHPNAGVRLAFKSVATGKTSFATTDASGGYSIGLPAGDYLVGPSDEASLGPTHRGGPRLVTVGAGKTVTEDFSYTIQLL